MTKRIWIAFVLITAVLGALIFFALPPYILNLVTHPDGSYLSALLARHQLKNPTLHTPEFYASFVPAVAGRLLIALAAVAAACLYLATGGRRHLIAFWNTPGTAFNLGALRLLICWQVYWFPLDAIYNLPQLNYAGLNVPVGYGWLRFVTPVSAGAVELAMRVYHVLAALAFFGVLTRVTLPLLTLVGFFTMLGPQLVGKMNHYHHLWLALAALCFRPCGDALSVDRLWRRWRQGERTPVAASTRYGRSFVLLWTIMGLVYFFPGYWKFVVGGLEWAFSDNVQLKLLAKVFETGHEPNLRLYEYPWLCRLGGLATIAFEMTFPFAMIFPVTRALYAFGGLGFHEMNRQTMQIGFDSLEWFYLSFVDWSGLGRKLRGRAGVPIKRPLKPTRGPILAGAVLISGLVVTGFASIDSWPWAVYPTFAAIEQDFVNSIEARVTAPDGATRIVLLQDEPALIEAYADRTRLRAFLTYVMVDRDEASRLAKLDELRRAFVRGHPDDAPARIDFWQVEVPLIPRGAPRRPHHSLGVRP